MFTLVTAYRTAERLLFLRGHLGSPAARPAFEEMAMVEEAVEHGSDGGAVAEQFRLM